MPTSLIKRYFFMAKIKKVYKEKYTIVSTDVFMDKRLKLVDRGLLTTMLSLPDNWDFSIAGLAAIVPDGETAVRSALTRLEKLGYLKRTRLYKDGKVYDWEYSFADYPLYLNKNLDVENQQVGNQQLDNLDVGSEPRTNKQEDNKNNIKDSKEADAMETIEYEGMNLTTGLYTILLDLKGKATKHEISSSPSGVVNYFRKLYDRGFKDSKGRRIRNIEGYIIKNFQIQQEQQEKEKILEETVDELPTYDTSKNRQMSEEEIEYLLSLREKE